MRVMRRDLTTLVIAVFSLTALCTVQARRSFFFMSGGASVTTSKSFTGGAGSSFAIFRPSKIFLGGVGGGGQQQQQQQHHGEYAAVPRGGAVELINDIGSAKAAAIAAAASSSTAAGFLEMMSDTKFKCWVVLFISIMIENVAAALIKAARVKESYTLFVQAALLFLVGNFGFFIAMDKIDLGIAYAVWSALGTAVLTAVGIICFDEAYNVTKLFCLSLIVLGVVGLNLGGGGH
eukprot:CAMPEP_0198151476 /NCGR_PEP_ID=MMETSP1443-20131203/55674_1 /TAXON_ID=186043 /ORGANISM="Entomoneis sp., Strain CCMP2396" /LENGTH=233 /DNA_ID=CAMNT_0043817149 /DNA_START=98 /DNA_END=799 /DNA_ORIENTATION=-